MTPTWLYLAGVPRSAYPVIQVTLSADAVAAAIAQTAQVAQDRMSNLIRVTSIPPPGELTR
jgi:hypothetical protein